MKEKCDDKVAETIADLGRELAQRTAARSDYVETNFQVRMKAGRPARFDYEYERNGTANLFMMFAPLEGWRHVKVTDRHTAVDYARVLKDLADIHFAHAKSSGPGQSQHPQQGFTLRSLSGRRSQAPGRALRMAL